MSEMQIGVKTTKNVKEAFTPEEIRKFVERSIAEAIHEPVDAECMTLHYETKAGRLITYTFFHEEKWRCFLGFATETEDAIPEDFKNPYPRPEWN